MNPITDTTSHSLGTIPHSPYIDWFQPEFCCISFNYLFYNISMPSLSIISRWHFLNIWFKTKAYQGKLAFANYTKITLYKKLYYTKISHEHKTNLYGKSSYWVIKIVKVQMMLQDNIENMNLSSCKSVGKQADIRKFDIKLCVSVTEQFYKIAIKQRQ